MIVEVRAVAPFYKNGFVIGCERTREGLLIDPGDEVDELLAAVRDYDLQIQYILLTHAHIDHITGVGAAKSALEAPVYLHLDDLPLYEAVEQQGAKFGLHVEKQPPIDGFYSSNALHFGDYEVHVRHTPGHSPGGVCLQVAPQSDPGGELFVGDTLFAGSIGRADLPGGRYETLMASITDVLFPLGDDRVVHPGHGPDTTIGRERRTNPFVLEYLNSRA